LTQGFWVHAQNGKLSVQSCRRCGDRHYPASPVCPNCLSAEQEWEVVSGRGTLISWIEFHRAYWDGFAEDLPYCVCLVQLDEGPMLYSNLVGVTERTELVGKPVKAVFEQVTDTITLPKFTLS
jgi:hypothetical protein